MYIEDVNLLFVIVVG